MRATFKEFAFDMIPWVADEYAIIEGEKKVMLDRDYFIVAKTINGSRFYSPSMSWEDTTEELRKYRAMVKYFGGGMLWLYERTFDDYDIVKDEVVF